MRRNHFLQKMKVSSSEPERHHAEAMGRLAPDCRYPRPPAAPGKIISRPSAFGLPVSVAAFAIGEGPRFWARPALRNGASERPGWAGKPTFADTSTNDKDAP
jgi:hypothetical protein